VDVPGAADVVVESGVEIVVLGWEVAEVEGRSEDVVLSETELTVLAEVVLGLHAQHEYGVRRTIGTRGVHRIDTGGRDRRGRRGHVLRNYAEREGQADEDTGEGLHCCSACAGDSKEQWGSRKRQWSRWRKLGGKGRAVVHHALKLSGDIAAGVGNCCVGSGTRGQDACDAKPGESERHGVV
jgi:hypothetical protein